MKTKAIRIFWLSVAMLMATTISRAESFDLYFSNNVTDVANLNENTIEEYKNGLIWTKIERGTVNVYGNHVEMENIRKMFASTRMKTLADQQAFWCMRDHSLLCFRINDGSYDGTQWTATEYATGGNNDGILMKEYLAKGYWQTYATAGKLHRYFPLTVTSAKWATMYIGFCTQLPDNMKAYVVPEEVTSTTTSLKLKRINNKLHHTVPVIIYCEEPGTYILNPEPGMSSQDDEPMTSNKLQGTDIGQEGKYGLAVNQSEIQNEYSILTLSIGSKSKQVGFYGFPGTYIPPYKAYLTCNWVGGNGSPSFSVVIDDTIDETTGVSTIPTDSGETGYRVYDLSGRLVDSSKFNAESSKLKPGLYIVNAKMVVIK